MNGRIWLLISALILLTGLQFTDDCSKAMAPQLTPIQTPVTTGLEISQQVLSLLAEKCAGCHGPNLSQPEGRFGYVLDLSRLTQNPELVIPGQPEESELWILVQRDEMPPPESSAEPLTSTEKDLVRRWIAEGGTH